MTELNGYGEENEFKPCLIIKGKVENGGIAKTPAI